MNQYVLVQWFGYESCWLTWLCMCHLRICKTYYPGLWLSGSQLQQQTWLDLLLSLGLCLQWFHITQRTFHYRQYNVTDLAESLISSYRHILGYEAGQSFEVETEWRNVSNALLKSIAITMTYGLVIRREVIVEDGCCGWAGWSKGILILEGERGRWFKKSWIEEAADYSFLNKPG